MATYSDIKRLAIHTLTSTELLALAGACLAEIGRGRSAYDAKDVSGLLRTIWEMDSRDYRRLRAQRREMAQCEGCGDPAGEGGALCPACATSAEPD